MPRYYVDEFADHLDFWLDNDIHVVRTLQPLTQAATAPPYVKGGMYFDTTLNKLRIGGATAWETVTSV